MPLITVRNDITKMKVDAIVNAANRTLLGGGGVDGAIHRAAGVGLLAECRTLGGCETGKAKITGGYNLPANHIIHTVGPIYRDGRHGERELLFSCYRESLLLARENNCESVAFPLISTGAYGYPKAEALEIATAAIAEFLLENEMTVYIVVFDKSAYRISDRLFSEIAEYVDAYFFEENVQYDSFFFKSQTKGSRSPKLGVLGDRCFNERNTECIRFSEDLDDRLRDIDESCSQMLLRKIDEKGMTDSECYKKANIDRKLFSKIRSDVHYKPSKPTALAFAISLELSLAETEDMLRKAGFALSHSNKFDIIIEYFISKGNYNIFEINEALFAFDQSLLGA